MTQFVIRFEVAFAPEVMDVLSRLVFPLFVRAAETLRSAPEPPAPAAPPPPRPSERPPAPPASRPSVAPFRMGAAPEPPAAAPAAPQPAARAPSPAPTPPATPLRMAAVLPRSKGRPAKYRSPERDAIIARDWPLGRHVSLIRDEINSLPGPPVDNVTIGQRAAKLGLARPDGFHGKMKAPVDVELLRAADYPSPVLTDHETALRWGAERGLDTVSLDLKAVNEKRVRLGLPPFVISNDVRQLRQTRDVPPAKTIDGDLG